MRKIIYGIFALILSVGMANAGGTVDVLTLDTKIEWPVLAFNYAVAGLCGFDDEIPSDASLGNYTGYNDESVGISDLPDDCGEFVLLYGKEYRQNRQISLKQILDMCMETIDDVGACSYLGQALVYYANDRDASATVAIEPSITDQMGTIKIESTDGRFYVNGALTYKYDGNPQMIDNSVYLADTNRIVGRCEVRQVGIGDYAIEGVCEMLHSYSNMECTIYFGNGFMSCYDNFAYDREDALYKLNNQILPRLRSVLQEFDTNSPLGASLNRAERNCVREQINSTIQRYESLVNYLSQYPNNVNWWPEVRRVNEIDLTEFANNLISTIRRECI